MADDGATQPTQIEFLIGGSTAGSTAAELLDMTFVPDGDLVPQSGPPRRLVSANNWQQVNDVRIYVFRSNDDGDFVYYKPADDDGLKRDFFTADDFTVKFDISPYVVWWGGDDDTDERHSFVGRMNLPQGQYRFLAVARDDATVAGTKRLADPNIGNPSWGWQPWVEAATTLDAATIVCARNKAMSATELFSGYTAETVVIDGTGTAFCRTITLNRAVAGIFLYVENIPATIRTPYRNCQGTTTMQEIKVRSIAVVHGKTLSDRVAIAERTAIAGQLNVTPSVASAAASSPSSSPSLLPMPEYYLIRIDIPQQTPVSNGIYVNTAPANTAHPNAMSAGAFVMPQKANHASGSDGHGNDGDDTTDETYDKSLYLVFIGQDPQSGQEIALAWRPVCLAEPESESESESGPASDAGSGSDGYDPCHFPILANHLYSIGYRLFADNGTALAPHDDRPLDLRKETSATINISVCSSWGQYYGGSLGTPAPGLSLDPDWGENPAGELQQ